jgi:stage III sporulation protein AF
MELVIKEWITNLTVIAVIAAIVDIFLPSGSFRKYTGFVFGIILLIVILQPLLKLMGQYKTLERQISGNFILSEMETIEFQTGFLEERQEKLIRETFKSNLENHITSEVKRYAETENVFVNVRFAENNGKTDISKIERIDIKLTDKKRGVNLRPVEIVVGSSEGKRDGKGEAGEANLRTDLGIREMIADILELATDKIHVTLQ